MTLIMWSHICEIVYCNGQTFEMQGKKANKAIHDKVPDKRVNQGGHKLSKNSAHWVRYEHETSSSAANSGRLKLDDTVCCIRP